MRISKSFFDSNSTIEIAKALLGKYLAHETSEGLAVGKIVETEAYLSNDAGSHSFIGKTKRNEQMFGLPGKAYIYLIYGMYNCFNVVTNCEGIGEAVLIRALEPVKGIELMKKRRRVSELKELCSGPGKLTKAMGIEKKHNGADLVNGKLKILDNDEKFKIVNAKRIGISKGADLLYRFYIRGNEFVSKN